MGIRVFDHHEPLAGSWQTLTVPSVVLSLDINVFRLLNYCWIVQTLPVFTRPFYKPSVPAMNKLQKPF